MVLYDLRLYFCRRLESERARLCDRGNGGSVERRTDEADCCATSLSRSRKVVAGVGDALGLLCVLAVSDHLVGQSSGRDRLVSEAYSGCLGWDSPGYRYPAFRGAFPVFAIKTNKTRPE